MELTRKQAVEMIGEHGYKTSDKTGIDTKGNWIDDSSFDETIGIKDSYTFNEIRNWLGY